MARVLMIAPTPFFADRGCHVRIYEQARCLARLGFKLVVLTYPIGYDPPGVAVRRISALSSYDRYEAGPSWPRLYLDSLLLREAWKLCARMRPDLIHAHLHEGALIGFFLKARFKVPLIFDYQGSLTKESVQHGFIRESGFMARAFGMVERWIEGVPDRIVVSAGTMAGPLLSRGLCVDTVPDGVDLEAFSPGEADPGLRQKLGLPADRPLAVYLGVLSQYQGTDILLKAARYLLDRSSPIHFLVMGYPDVEYRKMAAELGVEEAVTFTGRLDYFKAADYLRLGDLALAPKLAGTESNGKVLNYMACGLPTVAFDLPLNREIMGEAAWWVKPSPDRDQCAKSFAEAMAGILQEPDKAKALAAAGRRRVEQELSLQEEEERLAQVYQSLLGGGA